MTDFVTRDEVSSCARGRKTPSSWQGIRAFSAVFQRTLFFHKSIFFNDVDTEEESTLNPKYEQTVHSLERATSLWRKEICKNVKHDTDSPEKVGTDTN